MVSLVARRTEPGIELSLVLEEVALPLKEQVYSLWELLHLGLLVDKQVAVVARSSLKQF